MTASFSSYALSFLMRVHALQCSIKWRGHVSLYISLFLEIQFRVLNLDETFPNYFIEYGILLSVPSLTFMVSLGLKGTQKLVPLSIVPN